jgi:hypothetical protein
MAVELGSVRENQLRTEAQEELRGNKFGEVGIRRNPDGTVYDPEIREPAVEFRETRNMRLFNEELVQVESVPGRLKLKDAIIYPGDEQTITNAHFSFECKRETAFAGGDYTVRWKIFLDNSPPSSGEIDLGSLIERARKEGVADH